MSEAKKPRCLDEAGEEVNPNDPERLVWYSTICSFWTDDWSALAKFGPGIPCCPHCQSPGFQTKAGPWLEGAAKYDAEAEPGYLSFLARIKGTCLASRRGGMKTAWEEEKAARAQPDHLADLQPD